MNLLRILFLPTLLFIISSSSFATFKEGYLAYKNHDYKLAYEKWHEQAIHDDTGSQYALGLLFYKGEGVDENYEQAYFWFYKAAKNNDAHAQKQIGNMYLEGRGIDANIDQALFWFKRAALSGNPEHEYFYGFIYDYGKLVPQSYREASLWYKKAAEKGHAKAAALLGRVYLKGSVIEFEKRNFNAFVWIQLALSLGYKYELVKDNLINCERYLSSEEKKAAMELVEKKISEIKTP